MTDETQPTSEWEHSHALETGDEVYSPQLDKTHTAVVHDDGSVTLGNETFSEREITTGLRDGTLEVDGKSYELATY